MIVPKKKSTVDLATVRCQKCLEYGHYNYECKNKRKIVIRDSRTKILNKNLNKPAERINIIDNELEPPAKKKAKKRSKSSSSSSSSSSSGSSSSSSSSSDTSDSESDSSSSSSASE